MSEFTGPEWDEDNHSLAREYTVDTFEDWVSDNNVRMYDEGNTWARVYFNTWLKKTEDGSYVKDYVGIECDGSTASDNAGGDYSYVVTSPTVGIVPLFPIKDDGSEDKTKEPNVWKLVFKGFLIDEDTEDTDPTGKEIEQVELNLAMEMHACPCLPRPPNFSKDIAIHTVNQQ